jgi:hypothetical protein
MITIPCLVLLLAAAAPQEPAAAPAAAKRTPTFTQDVAPIMFASCARCHRTGEVAPFALLSYADARKHGKTIRQVVEDRFMPPWHPVPGYGEFRHSMRLRDEQVQTILAWVDADMPEGPKEALPPLPKFPEGWQLGEPDLVVHMKAGFDVPASGRDIYRNFAIPLDLPDDRWITAVEVRPSARAVLHHIIFMADETGEARQQDGQDGKPGYNGMRLQRSPTIGGWAVGGMPEHLPDGLGIKLPKGTDLVLQSHFHPSGKAATEQTTIGLYFAKKPPARTIVPIQLPPFFGIAAGLDIPAGDSHWRLEDSFVLPCDVDAVTVGGHAHMLCRTLRMQAEAAGGDKIPLLLIDDWDFDWQNRYTYSQLVRLPKGATVRAELVYDNSKDNPNNPNKPPKRVRWGRESTDEMGSITLMVVPADEKDLAVLRDAVKTHMAEGALSRFGDQLDARFKQYDKNNDGKISRDEATGMMRRFFDTLDKNHDGSIDKPELESMLKNIGGGIGGVGGDDDGGAPAGGGRGGRKGGDSKGGKGGGDK